MRERGDIDAAIARLGFPLGDEDPVAARSRTRARSAASRSTSPTKGERVAAYEALIANARRHRPDAQIQGVLVSPMAKKGVEIIIGTLRDGTFGPMVMVGLGGITTELFRDVVYRPAPVSAPEPPRCWPSWWPRRCSTDFAARRRPISRRWRH